MKSSCVRTDEADNYLSGSTDILAHHNLLLDQHMTLRAGRVSRTYEM